MIYTTQKGLFTSGVFFLFLFQRLTIFGKVIFQIFSHFKEKENMEVFEGFITHKRRCGGGGLLYRSFFSSFSITEAFENRVCVFSVVTQRFVYVEVFIKSGYPLLTSSVCCRNFTTANMFIITIPFCTLYEYVSQFAGQTMKKL